MNSEVGNRKKFFSKFEGLTFVNNFCKEMCGKLKAQLDFFIAQLSPSNLVNTISCLVTSLCHS